MHLASMVTQCLPHSKQLSVIGKIIDPKCGTPDDPIKLTSARMTSYHQLSRVSITFIVLRDQPDAMNYWVGHEERLYRVLIIAK